MCRSSVTARSPSRNELSSPPRVSSSSRHALGGLVALDCHVLIPFVMRVAVRSTQASSSASVAREQRHQGDAGDGLDQVGGGHVRPDLAARHRVIETIGQAARQDVTEPVEQLGVQRRVRGDLGRQSRAVPPARPAWSARPPSDAPSRARRRPASRCRAVGRARRSGTPPRARGAPCSASAGRSAGLLVPARWAIASTDRSAYPDLPSSSTVARSTASSMRGSRGRPRSVVITKLRVT